VSVSNSMPGEGVSPAVGKLTVIGGNCPKGDAFCDWVPGNAPVVKVSRLSWKWRKRSSVKIAERTYEKRTQALHC
jgi:hypothetical protein